MANRRFQLPGIQDLSKEQEDARALPMEGQHLIVGGPGTGKSILALLRSRRLSQEDVEYVFLVYNHLLNESSRQLLDGGLVSRTWNSWFSRLYKEIIDEPLPMIQSNSNWKPTDWTAVLDSISNVEPEPRKTTLVVDEGQDMPPEFYQSLVNLGFENFFVMADQNQQITDGLNSTRQDIETALAVETAEVIELTNNYRNKYPIARFAREFYTGDPASPPPELPAMPTISVKRPLCYEYDDFNFDRLIRKILKTSDRDPSKLIGILTYNNDDRKKYVSALRSSVVRLDNPMPIINTFSNDEKNKVSFNQGGILVINAQTCKGLEFDTVFIADINSFSCNDRNKDNVKRLFYVMVARAIDRVILLKQRGKYCSVDSILPADEAILERE
ncbi:ATP-binding domain-containing protein [Pseudomonadales bacterium]|nr:ATP-binding domain-containing protein [Pseudomonadales bacterium]